MKLTIESTSLMLDWHGAPARVWEGVSESGIRVHCIVAAVAVRVDDDQSAFLAELNEMVPPSLEVLDAYPAHMKVAVGLSGRQHWRKPDKPS